MIAAVVNIKFQQGLSQSSDAASKEATILAGDAILNYRTVASFGHEEQIVSDYDRLLEGPVSVAIRKCHSIALTFGFTQFIKFAVFAALYYFTALFMDKGWIPFTDGDKAWMAIFVMMFGASASGQA